VARTVTLAAFRLSTFAPVTITLAVTGWFWVLGSNSCAVRNG
jgi:hypothetical protein